MISLLFVSVSCVWWEFNKSEFGDKISASSEAPLFVLFSAKWCPDCKGVDVLFKGVAKKYDDNPNVTFSQIPCDRDRMWCYRMGATSIPQLTLIKGSDVKKWKSTHSKSPAVWTKLLKRNIPYFEDVLSKANNDL